MPMGFLNGYRNEQMKIATTKVDFDGVHWIVGALISEDEILAGVAKLRNITLVTSLILVVISLVIAFLFSRTITRPIDDVVQSMRKLIGGDKSIDLTQSSRKDEVGEMFQAVKIFRDAAIEKEKIEEESEENRTISEQERQRNEEAKAQDTVKINGVIEQLADALHELSEGNLTAQIKTPFEGDLDRVRVDFNKSVSKLNDTLAKISQVSTTLKDNSREMANTTVELSQRTETQAASLEETSAALDEITATVRETSERAKEAANKAKDAHAHTEQSGEVVAQAVNAMEGIEKASGDISNIINVIDEIAFQTNLLALNAGVEAARAGEAGKGFAVVAQEVCELAGRSTGAAKEIKELINRSISEVSNGVTLVQQTGDTLSTISEHVAEINTRIETISTGAAEQLTGIQEVNAAVNAMDQVTQQNAAMVEENTDVTQEMSEQVASLAGLISTFRVDGSTVNVTSSFGHQEIAKPQYSAPSRKPQDAPKASPPPRQKQFVSVGNAAVAVQDDADWNEF